MSGPQIITYLQATHKSLVTLTAHIARSREYEFRETEDVDNIFKLLPLELRRFFVKFCMSLTFLRRFVKRMGIKKISLT